MPSLASILVLLVVGFFFMTLVGFVIHWAIHQTWAGRLYRSHMVHHLKLYPVSDYLSNIYRNPGKDNSVVTFFILSLPFILAPVLLYWFHAVSLLVTVLWLVEVVAVGWLHDYLHDSFHIRHHFLKRSAYFRKLTDIHYQHHLDMQTNFGIFFFFWDRVFGKYVKATQAFLE